MDDRTMYICMEIIALINLLRGKIVPPFPPPPPKKNRNWFYIFSGQADHTRQSSQTQNRLCVSEICRKREANTINRNKASQAIQSPRTVPFFLLVSLLDGYSFPDVLVKGIVAFKH